MNFTPEQMTKAKQAKSAEELLALAKASGIAMTADEAQRHFAELHKEGELSDDELDTVAGGDKDDIPESHFKKGDWICSPALPNYYYEVLDVQWNGSDYVYDCFMVAESGGTACTGRQTFYEADTATFTKTTYANADKY